MPKIIYLFINFAKRPGSLTEQAPLQGLEKKKKISNTTNKNDNYTLIETTKKKKYKCKVGLGRTSMKNQQHKRSSKPFNGRLVWHLIHSLKGLAGVDIINRLISKIQVVIKKIFLEARYWTVSVPELG